MDIPAVSHWNMLAKPLLYCVLQTKSNSGVYLGYPRAEVKLTCYAEN